jgi:two-component system cell cycle response regulator DivK
MSSRGALFANCHNNFETSERMRYTLYQTITLFNILKVGPLKILAVDDHPTNLEIIQVLLRPSGHEVLTAETGEQALLLARLHLPDLIFMDLAMPGDVDGLVVTRWLKADPATRHIVIVALTAMVRHGDTAQALAAGCDDFIRKPYTRRQLLDLMTRLDARLKAGAQQYAVAAPR